MTCRISSTGVQTAGDAKRPRIPLNKQKSQVGREVRPAYEIDGEHPSSWLTVEVKARLFRRRDTRCSVRAEYKVRAQSWRIHVRPVFIWTNWIAFAETMIKTRLSQFMLMKSLLEKHVVVKIGIGMILTRIMLDIDCSNGTTADQYGGPRIVSGVVVQKSVAARWMSTNQRENGKIKT
jgi:hypothetical protein